MTDLVKYDAACRAVAEAASIDEAKGFRDKSEAMRAYAKQAKNKQLEVQAAEIRIRAERRIGELMAAQRDAGELATAGRPSDKIGSKTNPISAAPTLAEAGIDKSLADRARKYAAIPEQEFNGIVSEWKGRVEQENERVNVNLLAAGKRAEVEATSVVHEPHTEEDKERRKLALLTTDAMIDEIMGLRAAVEQEREQRLSSEARTAELEVWWRTALEGSNIGRALGAAEAQVRTLNGRLQETMQNLARADRQIRALRAENDRLRGGVAA